MWKAFRSRYEGREFEPIGHLEGIDATLCVTVLDGLQIGHLEGPDGHIPNRNLLLIGTAVAALQPSVVYLGVLRGETSRDKSRPLSAPNQQAGVRQTSFQHDTCAGLRSAPSARSCGLPS